MKTADIARRLDEYFHIIRYPASDFDVVARMSADAGIPLASYATPEFMMRFNGLMLDNAREVEAVFTAVFTSEEVIDGAIAYAAGRPALIFTHHPMDFETSGRGLLPMREEAYRRLKDAGISLYSSHAPLDCHEEVSTSRALARAVDIKVEDKAGMMEGYHWGVRGVVEPMPLEDFLARVRDGVGVERLDVNDGARTVQSVAVIAGGAAFPELMEDAIEQGCDTYLTGDFRVRHGGDWAEEHRPAFDEFIATAHLNLVGASHYRTEALVMEADMLGWFNGLGLPSQFLPQADPWR
jgi:putative NIF3 family GTP cyclohydrolase 1 type 2